MTERMRILNNTEPGIFLVDQSSVQYSNRLDSKDWLQREHAVMQRALRDEDVTLPLLENLPQIAQASLDSYRDSMANLKLMIPDYSLWANAGDSKITPLSPVENFHRIIKETACDMLGTIRSNQVETTTVFFPDEADGEPPVFSDKITETGLLSEKQLEGLSECVFKVSRAISMGMPSLEIVDLLMRQGALSFHSAVGILSLVTATHTKLLIQSEKADLVELLQLFANPTAISRLNSDLDSAAEKFGTFPSDAKVPLSFLGNLPCGSLRCFFLLTF